MRILLTSTASHIPPRGGSTRSNLIWLDELAAHGHTCRVVGGTAAAETPERLAQLQREMEDQEMRTGATEIARRGDIEIHSVASHSARGVLLRDQIRDFAPDWVLVSSEDIGQSLLRVAHEAAPGRVVYLAHTPQFFPFGPASWNPDPDGAALVARSAAIIAIGEHMAAYIKQHAGRQPAVIHPPIYGSGPFERYGTFQRGAITMINPCAVKGISIFLALADEFPIQVFGALPGWGTTEEDRQALAARPNITMLRHAKNIDEVLNETHLLLVPSLWAEARSRIVVEAMLRGVPVIASDIGGIPEAKLGVDYLLPVRPIEKYQERVDEQMVPVAEVPAQDIGPWENALRRLISDREHFRQLSRESREAALRYAENLSVEPFERFLKEVVQKPQARPSFAGHVSAIADPLEKLSPDKRRLLALRLRKPTAAGNWFSSLDERPGAKVRLFCFPHAGAGASAFRGWRLPAEIAVCPVMLPGRESRIAETPFDSMAPLVEALSQSVGPHLERPFVFFGHSMGAVIAFELARSLRRTGRPLPLYLLVSGARAPQFRRGHVPPPPPSDTELLDQLCHLDGTPREVLGNDELMRMMLPAMRADTTLYRNYIYVEEPPLACPIRAYSGLDDPNIRRAQLEAWAAETTADFKLRMFPGGHFYLNSAQAEFLEALARDLLPLTVRG